jgi:hypothetical protein
MATKSEKKSFYAQRNFKDQGTSRFFARGAEITDATDGEIGNYAAAGLVATDPPKSPAEAEKAVLEEALG